MGIKFLVTSRSFIKMIQNPYRAHLAQEWCRDNFPTFIDKDRRPPNNPDLNPLDDAVWDKLINVIDWNEVR